MIPSLYFKHVIFTDAAIKFSPAPDLHPYDIVFRFDIVEKEDVLKPFIPGTKITTFSYSQKLLEQLIGKSRSELEAFINYQLKQQAHPEIWLHELSRLVDDNQKTLNVNIDSNYLTILAVISMKFQEINPPAPESSEVLSDILKWTRKDVDLLELITALHLSGAINNEAGNLKRNEAISIFENIFGIKIKDPESKLSKATDRKRSTHPFLDELVKKFDEYSQKKDE